MATIRALITASAFALAPALVEGQLIVSTGTQVTGSGANTRDTRWQVGFSTSGLPTSLSDAFRIQGLA